MNIPIIIFTLGNILKVESILLILPLIISLIYKESIKNTYSFLIVMILLLIISFISTYKKPQKTTMQAREGFVIVSLSWIALSFFGAMPFVISGDISSFVDAFFETVSGFTTTGSSILKDVEALSNSMLFWRSLTQLIGGMGVLVFALAFLPSAGLDSLHIMKAEVPGPVFGKLVAKMRVTAVILYKIYLIITAITIVLLMFGGMNLFEASVHAFSAAGTGGFGIKNSSIAYYNSAYIEIVIGIAMLIFAVNFNLYYLIISSDITKIWQSEELKLFLKIVALAIALIFINIGIKYGFSLKLLRDVFFQVSSIITTTGFASADYNKWPILSKLILLIIMFVGGCSGSTAGGLKVSRIGILIKTIIAQLKKTTEANRVISIKFDGKIIESKVVMSIINYFGIYMFVFAFLLLAVCLDNVNFETAFSAVAATYNNIGPGLDVVGPTGNFSSFSAFSKIILSFSMILGRLEIYPIIILFTTIFKNDR